MFYVGLILGVIVGIFVSNEVGKALNDSFLKTVSEEGLPMAKLLVTVLQGISLAGVAITIIAFFSKISSK